MLKLKACVLFFIIIILINHFNFGFCDENPSFDLEPIVITKSTIHLFNPFSLDSPTLKNLPFSSLPEVLAVFPLDLQSRSIKSGIQTDFSLRGSTFQGVLLLVDGQRINDPQTGHHNSDIPFVKEDIERIEVIPGVGSSLFGPDAIGGAINFILKKPKEKRMILETSFGQHQTKSGLFSISDRINNLGLRFSLENQESGGFYEDTDYKKFTSSLYSVLNMPYGEFDLSLAYQEKEFGAYDFYTPKSGYHSKEWTKTYLLSTGFNLEKHGFLIKPNFLWRRHFDKFMLDKSQLRSTYLNHHRTDVYMPNIYFRKENDIFGGVGLGLEYAEERINSTNLGKHRHTHKSIFMDDSKDLTHGLSLGLSFRLDDFDGFDKVYTGSANTRYRLSKENSLHLGLSRSIRIPSFTELYYNDPTTLGNPGLSPERALNYQIGYDYKKEESFSFGMSIFFRDEKDFIDWVKRLSVQTKWQVENITEADVFGIETYLRLNMNPYLKLESNYIYVDKRIHEQNLLYKYGRNYIRHLMNTMLNFNLPFGIQTLTFSFKKKPNRDGWFILNTHFSYNLNKNTQLFLKITNLFNVEYQEIEGIPQPGRWAEVGLRIDW